MADYAISPEFLKSYRDWQNQRQATTGIAPRAEDLQALSEANLNTQASNRYRDKAIQQDQQRIDIQKQQIDDQKKAAAITGASNIVTSAALTYTAGKSLGWWGASSGAGAAGTGSSAAGTGTAAGGGSNIIGTAGTYAGYAAAGYYLNRLMDRVVAPRAGKWLGENWGTGKHGFTDQTSAIVGDLIGGTTGEKVADWMDPAGVVVKKTTDNVHKVTGTIICAELNRQGIISDRQRRYGMMFGKQVGEEVYRGYLVAAEPIVARMKASKLYTRLVSLFAIPAIKEISHRVHPRNKGSIFGSIVLILGIRHCLKVYDSIEGDFDVVSI